MNALKNKQLHSWIYYSYICNGRIRDYKLGRRLAPYLTFHHCKFWALNKKGKCLMGVIEYNWSYISFWFLSGIGEWKTKKTIGREYFCCCHICKRPTYICWIPVISTPLSYTFTLKYEKWKKTCPLILTITLNIKEDKHYYFIP